MKSLEAIRMSKLIKKSAPMETAKTPKSVPLVKTLDIQHDESDLPTVKTGGSASILKAHKVGSNKGLSANLGGFDVAPKKKKLEGEVELGPTEVQRYSPIKNYLKKGK